MTLESRTMHVHARNCRLTCSAGFPTLMHARCALAPSAVGCGARADSQEVHYWLKRIPFVNFIYGLIDDVPTRCMTLPNAAHAAPPSFSHSRPCMWPP